jgi:RNA polymerase sigma-70 factor (ECF subfamily)
MELFGKEVHLPGVVHQSVQPQAGARLNADPSIDRRVAFMRALNEHRAVLSRVAYRLAMGQAELAEDCIQEAVVKAYKAYVEGRFRDDHRFRPWILTILTNEFLMDRRKQSRIVTSGNIEAIVEARQFEQNHGPEGDESLKSDLEAALTALSPEQRACVVLVDIEELDYKEAARALGTPIGTVRSRLNRARLKMAELILGRRADRAKE